MLVGGVFSSLRLVILVAEDLLTTLAAGHTLLLLLAELSRRKLGLLLGALNLVTHSIEFLKNKSQ